MTAPGHIIPHLWFDKEAVEAADFQAMMREGCREQVDRVTQAFLPMKRLDIASLRAAYDGR